MSDFGMMGGVSSWIFLRLNGEKLKIQLEN